MIDNNLLVDFIGEIGDYEKLDFFSGVFGLLFFIDWLELFGFVMIEVMVCGMLVVVFNCGLVFEIIDDGLMGFVVEDVFSVVGVVGCFVELDCIVICK